MQRRDVVAAIFAAVLLANVYLFGASRGRSSPIVQLFDAVMQFWYVGALVLAIALLLQARKVAPRAARVVGLVGLTWVVIGIGYPAVFLVLWTFFGPGGP